MRQLRLQNHYLVNTLNQFSRGNLKTLIVEDEPTTRLLLAAIVHSRGFESTACETAEEAWDIYQSDTYPLVILDWLLAGGMDGLELCRKIRKLPQGDRSVILVITSRNKAEDLQAVLEAGADDYLAKPIDVGFLEIRLTIAERQIKQLLARKEAEAALAQTAGKIQQSVLLGQPPKEMSAVDIEALTIPSQEVDGDFYDFIKHDEWNLDIIVGDVMGKGIAAALLGAAIKSQFLRAISQLVYATEGRSLPPVERIVSVVHDEMASQLIRLESFATYCYARVKLEKRVLEFIDCGHTKTIHYRRNSDDLELLQGNNMPLGFSEYELYEQVEVPIGIGDLFCFYSDGVTETRNFDDELFGEERLADLVRIHKDREPDEIVSEIKKAVIEFGVDEKFADDLTCVVIKISSTEIIAPITRADVEIKSNLKDLVRIREFVHRFCLDNQRRIRITDENLTHLELAVHETASNVIRHAYNNKDDRLIQVRGSVYPDKFTIELFHTGKSFNPESVIAPSFDGSRDGGFGLYIISQCMDEVKYYQDNLGRQVILLGMNIKDDVAGEIDLDIDEFGDVVVLNLPFISLDASDVADFKLMIHPVLQVRKKVVFNLENMKFIDSSGFGALISCLKLIKRNNGELKICGLTKPGRAIFNMVNMDRMFDYYDSVNDAVRSFSKN